MQTLNVALPCGTGLTVAIATMDRPEGLARCLDALLHGAVLPDEVVIIDQSEDEKAKGVVEQCRVSSVSMIYIRQARHGLSASRNAAFTHASRSIVAVTDDDCVPDKEWVSIIKQTFSSMSAPDAMTGRILPLGPDIPGLFAISSRVSTVPKEFRGKVVPWLVGSGGNCAVKKEWFDRVGGYDERLGTGSPGMAAEDADFFYRLLRAGACIRYEPEGVIFHERQSKSRRLATCWSYGHGIGAFCSLWFRRRDLFALRTLAGWISWQCWYLIFAIGRGHWIQVHQRWLSLRGTIHGFRYGLFVG
jgi:GT2 family glycosyltransferase